MQLISYFFVLCVGFSKIALGHEIDTDYCNPSLYTKEVYDIICTDKDIQFKAKGLPASDQTLMVGITATNQQMPRQHAYSFKITRSPKVSSKKVVPDSGPIGVAVNGIPIFDPSTQGKVDPATGKRPNTLATGELDRCGGHAGRGDDYHYHIAPICLINELGEKKIERLKQPVGFAMDGFPILALGWFDKANDVEKQLDACRGLLDDNGNYFYNVKNSSDWDILTCFNGVPKGFAKDSWTPRLDTYGNEIVGYPVGFNIKAFSQVPFKPDQCAVMSGILSNEQLLQTDGSVKKIAAQKGDIFYCNQNCYGMFFEADKKPQIKGRTMYYEKITSQCPSGFLASKLNPFLGYEGPKQTYKAPQSVSK